MTGRYIADAGPTVVEIYLFDDGAPVVDATPRPYARYRLVDVMGGTPEDVLEVHRWTRIGEWFRSDDTPPDHRLVAVEPRFNAAQLPRPLREWGQSRVHQPGEDES